MPQSPLMHLLRLNLIHLAQGMRRVHVEELVVRYQLCLGVQSHPESVLGLVQIDLSANGERFVQEQVTEAWVDGFAVWAVGDVFAELTVGEAHDGLYGMQKGEVRFKRTGSCLMIRHSRGTSKDPIRGGPKGCRVPYTTS
jgi:hypothetical protein